MGIQRTRLPSLTIALVLGLFSALLSTHANAAVVNGGYQGTISIVSSLFDSPQLVGETMHVAFSYDDATAGIPVGTGVVFNDALISLTVTVLDSVWTWPGAAGTSSISLTNDNTFFVPTAEDVFGVQADGLSGPNIGTAGTPDAISFRIGAFDIVPAGAPDGLTTHDVLPGVAPNADLFSGGGLVPNRLQLTFDFGMVSGSLVTGDLLNATPAPVPLPAAFWFLLSAVGALGFNKRRTKT